MSFTPQDVITQARYTVNDADSVLYRLSNDELVGYVNDGIAEISRMAPALFNTLGDFDCIANQCDQTLNFSDAQEIVDVLAIHGGDAVTLADMATLDAFLPGWRSAAAGQAKHWMRKPNDPLRFFIYPKAPDAQTLDVLYVKNPATVTLSSQITEIPATLKPALVHYVIFRAESKDDEHALSGRAAASYKLFDDLVKGPTA